MSSYTTSDFYESMKLCGIDFLDIEKVQWAYGNIDDKGKCCEQCGGEWSGGFAFIMKDGRHGVVEGWCDYTGWGCQDGADVSWSASNPDPPNGADIEPIDLNNYIKDYIKDGKYYE